MTCCLSLQKELKEIERDKKSGVSVLLNGDNIHRLTGFLEGISFPVKMIWQTQGDGLKLWRESRTAGPKDTAYQGGYFVVDIKLGGYLFRGPHHGLA